ncbi:MAG: prephenate dehydratase [Deltaproteobacteria bacterium]|nr:MAG: prephenate dehydratase [Deltaproteobacteria bacterium]
MAGDDDELARLRAELDAVDDEILAALNRRAAIVERVAAHKRATGAPYYVADRERQIIERLTAANPGPFPTAAIRPVVQEIVSACRSLEKGVRVAYLGPEGTFTHQAAKLHFGASCRAVPAGTIAAVFAEVTRGQADFGVVPVENSSEGIVSHTLDEFVDRDLQIVAEVFVQVSHCLLVHHDIDEGAIARVYSHPQALAQCRGWLRANLPRAALVETTSTADAARAAQTDAAGAAIASELAAKLYDLRVLRRQLQDVADNRTRFLVVGPPSAAPPPTGRDKTSALLVLRDKPGALYEALKPLSEAGVNLTKIESRPSRRRPWEYVFFLDMDGHAADPALRDVLDAVAAWCEQFKVLGSYPKVNSDG